MCLDSAGEYQDRGGWWSANLQEMETRIGDGTRLPLTFEAEFIYLLTAN